LERENKCFRIDLVTSAVEAFELLNVNNYDVVISDYQMPGMDGLEFLQNLRENGNTIPFIMLTGKGREEVTIEALNRGADHYLHKGRDLESLYRTLNHVIREVVEKTRAKDKLAAIEREHQILLNSLPLNIFHINRDGEFVHGRSLKSSSVNQPKNSFRTTLRSTSKATKKS
jgi:DNA-binding response OmpR family regulator